MNSRFLTTGRILFAAAVVVILLLLRYCGSCSGDASAPEELNIRYDAAPGTLNPFLSTIGPDLYTSSRIILTLGDTDPETLEIQPMLVTSIPQSRVVAEGIHKGELAFDLEIMPEAVWDNGSPVTGNDVAFSFKIIYHPLLPTKAYANYFKQLTGIEVDPVNPKKFTFYFSSFYMLAKEAIFGIPILPAYNYDPSSRLSNIPFNDFLDSAKVKAFEKDPGMVAFAEEFQQPKYARTPEGVSGAGPYKLFTMNEQGVILVKKDNWWGDKLADKYPLLRAYPKKLVYKEVKTENQIETMLNNGELDIVAHSIDPVRFLEMSKKDSLKARYDFDLLPLLKYNRWVINLTKPILKDVRVRKAMAHIVDYDHFINNIWSGMATRTSTPIPPAKSYYAKDIVPYDFNIDKARQLLAEAGWADTDGDGILDKMEGGQKVKLTIQVMVPPRPVIQRYAESVKETGRLAGIEIVNVPTEINDIIPKTKSGDFETAFLGVGLRPGLTELGQRYSSQNLSPAGDNCSRYVNPKVDELINRIGTEEDEAKRNAMYVEVQKIIHEDLPEIFLFAPKQPIITSKRYKKVLSVNSPGYYEALFEQK